MIFKIASLEVGSGNGRKLFFGVLERGNGIFRASILRNETLEGNIELFDLSFAFWVHYAIHPL